MKLPLGWSVERTQVVEALRVRVTQLHGSLGEQAEDNRLHISTLTRTLSEAQKRADLAELVVQSQSGHIASLERSNEKLLGTMMEMRRVGFSPAPEMADLQDGIGTVDDDDAQALKDRVELAARPE